MAPLLGPGGFAGPIGVLVPSLIVAADAEGEIALSEVEERDEDGGEDTEVQYVDSNN